MKQLRTSGIVLGAALIGSTGASGVAWAQGAGDNYFVVRGRAVPIARAGNWVGVKVTPNSSSTLLRGLQSEAALDKSRAAKRFPSRNVVLVPVDPGASAAQKNALQARLGASSRVEASVGAYIFNGAANSPLVDSGDIVVRFKSGGAEAARAAAAAFGGRVSRSLGSFSPNTWVLRFPAGVSGVRAANVLAQRRDVDFSHPDFFLPLRPRQAAEDPTREPLFPQQWHLQNTGQSGGVVGADIKAPQAWRITRGSPSVTIAILDDGVDVAHEDLAANIVPGFDFVDNDADPSPTLNGAVNGDNHGTSCAGVAAAVGTNALGVTGAAPNCKIMPIRMLGTGQTATTIARAMDFAVQNGADILSNSYGYDFPGLPIFPVIQAAVDRAVADGRDGKGAVILFAAGNESQSIDPGASGLPTLEGYDPIIAVGSSNNLDRHSAYSNTGRALDIVAPSNGFRTLDGATLAITTTDRMGEVGYDPSNYTTTFGGTSSACPLVAGVAALLLSVEPNLTYTQVRERLQETADKIDQGSGTYNSDGQSTLYGYGRVNAFRALLGRAPKVNVTEPRNNTSVRGTVLAKATTSNDERISRMVFDTRRIYVDNIVRDVGIAIPDFNFEGVSDTLTVGPGQPKRFVATSGSVRVQIDHTYVGDLQIALVHTNAQGGRTREVLYDHTGGGERSLDLNIPLPVATRPISGAEYTLEVIDDVQEDVGTFETWSLRLGSPFSPVGVQTAANHTLATEWEVPWNTDLLTTGSYELRATALTSDNGVFRDSNFNIAVAGLIEPTYGISGRVVDTSGRGVANVLITNTSNGAIVRTNANGEFSLPAVLNGAYNLSATLQGGVFTPATLRTVVNGAAVTNVRFTLSQRDLIAPTLTVTSPAAKSVLRLGGEATGTATDTGSGIARVTGVLFRTAVAGSSVPSGYLTSRNTYDSRLEMAAERSAVLSSGSRFALRLPSDEGTYRLTLRAYDRANNVRTTIVEYVVDRTAAVVTITNPRIGTTVRTGTVTATGTSADKVGMASVSVVLYRFAAGTTRAGYYNPATRQFVALAQPPASYEIRAVGTTSWSLRLPTTLASGRYQIRATATDRAGNKSYAVSTFTVTTTSTPAS